MMVIVNHISRILKIRLSLFIIKISNNFWFIYKNPLKQLIIRLLVAILNNMASSRLNPYKYHQTIKCLPINIINTVQVIFILNSSQSVYRQYLKSHLGLEFYWWTYIDIEKQLQIKILLMQWIGASNLWSNFCKGSEMSG